MVPTNRPHNTTNGVKSQGKGSPAACLRLRRCPTARAVRGFTHLATTRAAEQARQETEQSATDLLSSAVSRLVPLGAEGVPFDGLVVGRYTSLRVAVPEGTAHPTLAGAVSVSRIQEEAIGRTNAQSGRPG